MLEAFLTYAGQVVAGVLAFLALWKDAADYGELSKKFGKHIIWLCAGLMVVLTAISIYLTHAGRKQAIQDKIDASNAASESRGQIMALSRQVIKMSQDRAAAEKGFRDSFSQLSDKIARLQTEAATQKLSEQLTKTQAELEKAEAKLTQPKATLVPTFQTTDIAQIPIRTKVATLRPDGSVSVDVTVYNNSDVPALDGGVLVRICITCKFAKEPSGSIKVTGGLDSDREFQFQHVFPHSAMQALTVEIIPPVLSNSFQLDIRPVCTTGETQDLQHFTVVVAR
jgi:hypothetical protein